jgi:chaperonin GroEL (HSP60 family)
LREPLNKLLQLSQMAFLKDTSGWEGYDFHHNRYVDMYEAGIVDSVTVVRNCIIDSVSLAGMLLSL